MIREFFPVLALKQFKSLCENGQSLRNRIKSLFQKLIKYKAKCVNNYQITCVDVCVCSED
jgi:hypothetical protein